MMNYEFEFFCFLLLFMCINSIGCDFRNWENTKGKGNMWVDWDCFFGVRQTQIFGWGKYIRQNTHKNDTLSAIQLAYFSITFHRMGEFNLGFVWLWIFSIKWIISTYLPHWNKLANGIEWPSGQGYRVYYMFFFLFFFFYCFICQKKNVRLIIRFNLLMEKSVIVGVDISISFQIDRALQSNGSKYKTSSALIT